MSGEPEAYHAIFYYGDKEPKPGEPFVTIEVPGPKISSHAEWYSNGTFKSGSRKEWSE